MSGIATYHNQVKRLKKRTRVCSVFGDFHIHSQDSLAEADEMHYFVIKRCACGDEKVRELISKI